MPDKKTTDFQSIKEALFEFQNRFEGVEKRRVNPHFQSKYANLDDVINAIKPLLQDLLLVVSYTLTPEPVNRHVTVGSSEPQLVTEMRTRLECEILHLPSGQTMTSSIVLHDEVNPHVIGSALTYYKRYLLCAMLSIVETEDDDGNIGARGSEQNRAPMITEAQHSDILDWIEATAPDEEKFVQYLETVFQVNDVSQLTSKQANVVLKTLKQKFNRMQSQDEGAEPTKKPAARKKAAAKKAES